MKDSKLCPRYHRDPEAVAWIPLFRHYRDGHLYRAGGISNQPALYLAAMRLMQAALESTSNGES